MNAFRVQDLQERKIRKHFGLKRGGYEDEREDVTRGIMIGWFLCKKVRFHQKIM